MTTEDEIRDFFTEKGMSPTKVHLFDSPKRYLVNIGVEGTDDRYLTGSSEAGSDDADDRRVSPSALQEVRGQIDGGSIPSGTIRVLGMMRGCHFRLTVE